jgi:CHAT domain-containing protein/tetratricopeptide (TPR) repeat protein
MKSFLALRHAARRLPLLLAAFLCGAETAPPMGPPLHDGFTQEREIRGGETQAFPVEIQEGQFLRVTVQEDGIDLGVRLLDPQGIPVAGADSLSFGRPEVTEDLAAVGERAGGYRIEVAASGGKPGRYVLRVEGPRTPEIADRSRAEAVQATWRGLVSPTGSDEEQIRSLERAATLWEELGERQKEARLLYSLGRKRQRLGRDSEAVGDLQRSAALWAKGGQDRAWEAKTINATGASLESLNRTGEARSAYEQALAIAREIGNESLQGAALSNLGLLASNEGETRKGIELQLQALELKRKAGDKEIETLSNLAYAYRQVSENQKAIKFYQETLALARSAFDRNLEALALNQLADLSSILGDFEKSLSQYQAALALNHAAGERIHEAKTLANLGTVYQHLGRFDEARSSYDKALALAREVKDVETQTQTLISQSSLALKLGQAARALALAQQTVPLAAGGSREGEAASHFALGRAYLGLRNRPAARRELEAALALDRQRGDLPAEADVTLTLARLDRDAGDLPAALSQVGSALEIVESLRTLVVDQGLRTSFSAARQDYYELKIETLMALHAKRRTESFAADALQASERARARTLLEVLKESEADIREGADPVLVEREHRLREEVNDREWLRVRLLAQDKPDPTKLTEAGKRVDEALDEYQRVQASLRESSPRYAALTQPPQSLGLAEIQARTLDGQALLLEYSLGAKRSFLWVVGPHSFDGFPLPGRDVIERLARRYYELLTVRNERRPKESVPAWRTRIASSDVEAERAGRELSRRILKPAAKLLGNRPLLVVADGALQYIPFAALPIPASGEPLGTKHEVVSLPSATALAALRSELRERAAARRELAIFADPVFQRNDPRLKLKMGPLGQKGPAPQSPFRGPARTDRDTLDVSNLRRLPFSEKEAETIAALIPPAQVFRATGFAASKSKATGSEMKDFRKLHFATHGVLDTLHPELSGLVLSLYDEHGQPLDGVLRLNDIYNLRLGADLVVLSACRTALGKEWRGEGLIGLTRGFMYAGAARVLASLWSVEDQATAELMGNFYRGMLREGLSPAAALRKAQLEMRRDPKRKSPYYWAGFSLQGEWR